MSFDPNEHPHTRFNPLKNEWILVSPRRILRPWGGHTESTANENVPPFDPTNPLCPGVTRSSGLVTPNYTSTYVFTNDFPALSENTPAPPPSDDPLFQAGGARGNCRVMSYHPKSNVDLATMTIKEIEGVIKEWIKQIEELGQKYTWVQIFENRGPLMGRSTNHPHCQIWSLEYMPTEAKIKDDNQRIYFQKNGGPLLMDYVEKELERKERIVHENEEWIIVVPYWALWPFETMILPKKHVLRFNELNGVQQNKLAEILSILLVKYDNLFKCCFTYAMGWHGAPTGCYINTDQRHWTFHGIFLPPILRNPTVRKFMVGFELLGQAQRDFTAELAARELRSQPNVHYSLTKNLNDM